jgi:hypothetical protein
MTETGFAEDHIDFLRYGFPGATLYPAGILTAAQIRDADWDTTPPEIRTKLGETLFISAEQKLELERFCHRHGIAKRHRPDIWGALLEPFLDCETSPEYEGVINSRLREAGLTEDDVAEIRTRLSPLMVAYNFGSGIWEWFHLGLFDLLDAASGSSVEPDLRATLGDLEAFYAWAMQIAERAS